MERLTDRFDDKTTIGVINVFDNDDLIDIPEYIEGPIVTASICNAIEKLAEYEDTGFTPEEIKQLELSDKSKENYTIELYNEMNETIKELLAMDKDDSVDAYALARIEELEKENLQLKDYIRNGIELGYIDDREGDYKKYI